tara:strand:- start:15063 stop:15527 length:465 start_codon:yes stop_codon:yes gene_type:complete
MALTKLNSASMPTHSVIQVVQGVLSTYANHDTGTFTDTGLTASITPSSSSNKILVKVAALGISQNGSSAKTELALLRGSTIIQYALRPVLTNGSATFVSGACAIEFLDTPSTTSATTYKLQFRTRDGGDSIRINDYHTGSERSTSTITLMEIKG